MYTFSYFFFIELILLFVHTPSLIKQNQRERDRKKERCQGCLFVCSKKKKKKKKKKAAGTFSHSIFYFFLSLSACVDVWIALMRNVWKSVIALLIYTYIQFILLIIGNTRCILSLFSNLFGLYYYIFRYNIQHSIHIRMVKFNLRPYIYSTQEFLFVFNPKTRHLLLLQSC